MIALKKLIFIIVELKMLIYDIDMNVCEICNYDLEISKITPDMMNNITTIKEPNEFIKLFSKKKRASQSYDLSMELLFDKKSLTDKLKNSNIDTDTATLIVEKFISIQSNTKQNSFCWKCTNCGQTCVLDSGIIMTTNLISNDKINEINNIDDIIDDFTYPRTKDFICPNCDDETEPSKKEAIIYRPNPKKYDTVYICVNCKTIF